MLRRKVIEESCCSRSQLKNAIVADIREMKLQPISHTITKVIQLYETKNSRHSVMIVGDTLTSKTVCWRVLQASMSRLNREGDENYQQVRVRLPPPHNSFQQLLQASILVSLYVYLKGLPSQPESGVAGRAVRRIRSEHQRMDGRHSVVCHASDLRRCQLEPTVLCSNRQT